MWFELRGGSWAVLLSASSWLTRDFLSPDFDSDFSRSLHSAPPCRFQRLVGNARYHSVRGLFFLFRQRYLAFAEVFSSRIGWARSCAWRGVRTGMRASRF